MYYNMLICQDRNSKGWDNGWFGYDISIFPFQWSTDFITSCSKRCKRWPSCVQVTISHTSSIHVVLYKDLIWSQCTQKKFKDSYNGAIVRNGEYILALCFHVHKVLLENKNLWSLCHRLKISNLILIHNHVSRSSEVQTAALRDLSERWRLWLSAVIYWQWVTRPPSSVSLCETRALYLSLALTPVTCDPSWQVILMPP